MTNKDFINTGLSSNQVEESFKKFGKNEIKPPKKELLIVKILKQFLDPMLLLLVISCCISFIVAGIHFNSANSAVEKAIPIIEAFVVLFIIVINVFLSIYQEGKSSKEMEELNKMMVSKTKVIRDSKMIIVDSSELVLGDLIFLEAGDKITADAKILESSACMVDESIITGESVLVSKSNNEEKKECFLYSGTNLANGTAKAVVTAIAENTEMGKISNLIAKEKKQLTPFQQKINKLSKYIGIVVGIISIITFFVYAFIAGQGNFVNGIKEGWAESITIAISTAIASIPEGLLTLIMIIFSSSIYNLSKENAIIKKLSSVETLGSTSVICSDKTGTLTQNKMTVVNLWTPDKDNFNSNKEEFKELLKYGTLCTNGTINVEKDKIVDIGDPTETSIVKALFDINITKDDLEKNYKRVYELPFDSDRKMMTVVCLDKNTNKYLVITKGSIDSITRIGECENKQKMLELNSYLAHQAQRIIAISYKTLDSFDESMANDLESNQTIMGFVSIIDPIRPEAKLAIQSCIEAGIRPIMITGDHKDTAVAIAKELGIMRENDLALTGAELSQIPENQYNEDIEKYSVYARVSPHDKIKIVKAWKSKDKVVAMTGDGVNDAPSLKAADIGCAMGITGTEISKQAADMILTDDNFTTIVKAIREGREVMYKIRKMIMVLFITTFSSLMTIVLGMITFGISIFSSLQILWNNVLAETILGIVISKRKYKQNFMQFKPEPKNASIISKQMALKIFIIAAITTIFSLLSFYIGSSFALAQSGIASSEHAFNITWMRDNWYIDIKNGVRQDWFYAGSFLAYLTSCICLLINSFTFATEKPMFLTKFKEIDKVIYSMLVSLFLIIFVSYIPYVNTIFSMAPTSNPTLIIKQLSWVNIVPYLFFGLLFASIDTYKFVILKKKQTNITSLNA